LEEEGLNQRAQEYVLPTRGGKQIAKKQTLAYLLY
jgi:hypothetical protein